MLTETLHKKWGWFLALGIALIVVGVLSLAMPVLSTLASVLYFGWALVVAAVFEAVALIRFRPKGGGLAVVGCLLSAAAGAMIVLNPAAGAAGLTLVIAGFFVTGGIARILAAAALRFPHWGGSVVAGIFSVITGIVVGVSWSVSSFWVIGTLVGVEILSRGFLWVSLASFARRLPGAAPRDALRAAA